MHTRIVEAINTLSGCIERAPGTLMVTNDDGRVLYANQALAAKTGFHTPQMIGVKAGTLWGGTMPKEFYANMWQTIKHRGAPWAEQVTNTYRQQNHDDYLHIAPIKNNEANNPKYFIEIHQPPSEKKKEEDFRSHFKEFFSDRHADTHSILSRVIFWVNDVSSSVQLSQTQRSSIDIIVEAYPNIANAIHALCIEKTRDVLHDRYDDEILIQSAKNDPAGFSLLYSKYYTHIHRYFVRHLGFSEISQDLTQDTFINAFAHIRNYTLRNASYKTYLTRIAHNLLVNHFRDTKNEEKKYQHHQYIDSITGNTELTIMREKIHNLGNVHSRVLLLKYTHGYSVREIAELLGKTENAIKLHLSRARKKIKQIYNK